jgi:hypothetical protein
MNNDIMFSNMGRRTEPMNNDQLFKAAPSIFAEAPKDDVSERYSFIPTIQMIDGLRGEGWQPVDAKQTKSRQEENRQFAKHMIRFQNPDLKAVGTDGIIPEVIMCNSHDRSAAYKFMLGLYRAICSNGLFTADAQLGDIKVRHNGSDMVDQAISACYELAGSAPTVLENMDRFKSIELDGGEQTIFAKAVLNYIYGVNQGEEDTHVPITYGRPWQHEAALITAESEDDLAYIPIQPQTMLRTRRREDRGDDLWSTLNVIQENVMKGGPSGKTLEGRRSSLRKIKSIDKEVKVNTAIWSLASMLADYKS